MKTFLFTFALAAAPLVANAATFNVTYSLGFGGGVPAGSIGLLVVDTAGDGFLPGAEMLGEELTVGSFLGADDYIAHRTTAVDFGGVFGFDSGVTLNDAVEPVSAGDNVAILWFDGAASEPIEAGQTGGFYRSDVGDAGGQAFELALGPGSSFRAFDGNFGGSASTAAITAGNFTVIPEPSAGLLSLLGVAGLIARRRRS